MQVPCVPVVKWSWRFDIGIKKIEGTLKSCQESNAVDTYTMSSANRANRGTGATTNIYALWSICLAYSFLHFATAINLQRTAYFSAYLTSLLKKNKPRYCAIECVRHTKESHIGFSLRTICCVEIAVAFRHSKKNL